MPDSNDPRPWRGWIGYSGEEQGSDLPRFDPGSAAQVQRLRASSHLQCRSRVSSVSSASPGAASQRRTVSWLTPSLTPTAPSV